MKYRDLLFASLLALPLSPGGAANAAPRDSLRVVLASPTQTLDPQRTPSMLSASLLKSAFEQLTRVSEDGSAQPLLAESWKAEPDGLSWLFRLRPNVRFHDGAVFDAQAVVANLSRVLDSKRPNPIRTNLGPITGAEVVDPQTVRIRTSRPFSGLPIALSHNVASMISPRAIEDGSADSGSRPIAGTGPFKVDSFNLPDEVTFVRNDQYWGAVPKLARIEARSRSDDQTRLASFLSGEADLALYLTPESRRRAEADQNLKLATIPSIRLFILHLPMGLPEMQDLRVRQALNLAIDRKQIIETLYQGAAQPADAGIGPGVFGYRAGKPYEYDVKRAAELLAQAGWVKDKSGILARDGKPFPTIPLLASRGRQPGDARLAQILAGYLRAIGVPTTLQIDEFATFFAAAQQESKTGTKFVQMAWGFPQMDGAAFLCSVYAAGNAYDFGNYRSDTVRDACNRIDATFDSDARAKLIADAVQSVYDDAAAVFIVSPAYLIGERKGLEGVVLNPGENHRLAGAQWK